MVDLGPYDGAPRVLMRLRFRSDNRTAEKRFYVDDFMLSASVGEEAYQYMSGKSMAAAFVSGIGALMLSLNPDLNSREMKNIIAASVDLDQDLRDELASGGRVNAYNALTRLEDQPLSDQSDGSSGGGGGCFIITLVN